MISALASTPPVAGKLLYLPLPAVIIGLRYLVLASRPRLSALRLFSVLAG